MAQSYSVETRRGEEVSSGMSYRVAVRLAQELADAKDESFYVIPEGEEEDPIEEEISPTNLG